MIRHGPMVLRVCRSVLHDAHDAEDAFQAVFLVLANRAGSIRRSGSVASWLFGVAQRVATRGRRSAARRHALDHRVAERTSETYLPAEHDPDWEILHEEIDGLPERLRAPIVLCYLQGLTYAAAAHQLGLSEAAIRGRLARARAVAPAADPAWCDGPGRSPRRRCGRSGTGGHPHHADPLHHSHRAGIHGGQHGRRPAQGSLEFHAAGPAQESRRSCCASASGVAIGPGMPSPRRSMGKAKPTPGPAVVRASASSQPPRTDRYGDPLPPGAAMRLGTVRFRQAPFIKHIVYSPDGQLVVTDSGQPRLLVWDARDGKKLRQIDLGIEEVRRFRLLARWEDDRRRGIPARAQAERRGESPDLHRRGHGPAGPPGRMGRPGQRREGRLRSRWQDRRDREPRRDAPALGRRHRETPAPGTTGRWRNALPESIAFSPDAASRLLAIASERTIDLWDVGTSAAPGGSRSIARDGPTGLAFSPDGTTLAAGIGRPGPRSGCGESATARCSGAFKSRKRRPRQPHGLLARRKGPGRDRERRPARAL